MECAHDCFDPASGGLVGVEDPVAVAKERSDRAVVTAEDRVVGAVRGVPRHGVAHEPLERFDLVPRALADDGV